METQTLTAIQSLIIALWVAAVMSRWLLGGATLTLRFSPLMTGLVVGLVMGNVSQAMVITAGLQLIYMGVFSPGGSMPSEPCVAAAIAVPVALISNLSAEAAIAVAVPVGLLGSYMYQFRFFLNSFVVGLTDKAAKELDDRKIARTIITYPTLISFILFTPVIFIALYFGVPLISSVINALDGTPVLHILDVVGSGLAAIGIATTIYVIGRKDYLVFFLLAYFMSVMLKPLGITMVTYAIMGLIIALIFVEARRHDKTEVRVVEAAPSGSAAAFDDDDDYDDGF